jgi:hypothetical protein
VGRANKDSQNYASSANDPASNGMNNSNKKKKVKGKTLKKAVSTNDKKRSHSAEPKQIKPTKKKSAASQNAKPVKAKKKTKL